MITTSPKTWKKVGTLSYATPEGIEVKEKELRDICTYYSVPATLLNIDTRFGTNTLQEVLNSHVEKVEILAEDGMHQVLDPKSKFVEDKNFEIIINRFSELTKTEPVISKNSFSKTVEFKIESDSNTFLSDVFSKSVQVIRLPQGGVALTSKLLRLVCTNGMILPDSQFKSLYRTGNVTDVIASAFVDNFTGFNIDSYFRSLFHKDGEPLQASVADYLGMAGTLKEILGDDNDMADILFPTEPIETFYASQGIDLSKISRSLQGRMPSGIDYYSCFNILTNGAKAAEATLDNHIKVANWAKPSRLLQLKNSEVSFKGMPFFSEVDVKSRMGDI